MFPDWTQLARNIVDYRTENGPFKARKELLNVKRMGAKAFEQCAGFLRIRNAENPLDSMLFTRKLSVIEQMSKDIGCDVKELMTNENNVRRLNSIVILHLLPVAYIKRYYG